RAGIAIGIIPGATAPRGAGLEYHTKGAAYPNHFVDVAVFTHLPGEDPEGERSRNHINVLSADLIVALPGGAGTHAEIQLAKRYGKPVVLFLGAGETILGKNAEDLVNAGFNVVHDFPSLLEVGNRFLGREHRPKPIRLELEKCIVR